MKGKTLSSQSQGLVLSLLNYFQQEKDNGGPLLPLIAVQEIYSEENSQDNLQPSVDDTNDQSELQSEKQSTEQPIENVIKSSCQSNGTNTIAKRKIFVYPKENPKRKMVTEDRRLSKAYDIIDSISSEPASSRDECSVYGEHVANKLRKLNERSRAILIHKINNASI
ncbi:unnamed protein product [Acanthoscelides obtectus]|uniref:Uncharacterized protein n=1 Tax=Acanthoscelides obtectus TaxID=200917 RepID=A0A9P0JYE8_ACAOB|nr:unnamed protein product [Acanthoscelides obtectus]CAK1648983.1 hypothetical protein AOBTE_LOCUS15984 [Acanthoscelides obtectus]